MILKLLIYIIGSFSFVWVLNSMIKEVRFDRYFFNQSLYCLKCLTFWITLIVCITIKYNILFSFCVSSIFSFIAYKLDNKINRNKKGDIKI